MNYSTGALPPCRALEELHIPGNRLLNIDAVFSLMPALDLLDVRENRIPEAAKIAPAASLPELIILRVRGNPLCDDDAYADAILGTSHTARTDSVCVPMFATVLRTVVETYIRRCADAGAMRL